VREVPQDVPDRRVNEESRALGVHLDLKACPELWVPKAWPERLAKWVVLVHPA